MASGTGIVYSTYIYSIAVASYNLDTVGQGPTALAVGADGGCLDIFTLIYPFSPLSPSLWEMARYRLKYCLKGPLNPNQPTNQPTYMYENEQLLTFPIHSIPYKFYVLGQIGLSKQCRPRSDCF